MKGNNTVTQRRKGDSRKDAKAQRDKGLFFTQRRKGAKGQRRKGVSRKPAYRQAGVRMQ